jgi:hypothetical protein
MKVIFLSLIAVFNTTYLQRTVDKVEKVIIHKISFHATYSLNITIDRFIRMNYRTFEVKDSLARFIVKCIDNSKDATGYNVNDLEPYSRLLIKYVNSDVLDTIYLEPTGVLIRNNSIRELPNKNLINYIIELDE